LPEARGEELLKAFGSDVADIDNVLKALSLVRAASERSSALISGFGELWSARLLAALLGEREGGDPVRFVDAREVLVIGPGEMGPIVLWDESRARLERVLPKSFAGIAVVTGY